MKKNLTTVLFLICLSLQALAQIIHIPSDYSTIQAGINAASDGDTVLVAEGLYYENINFKGKAITVASHFLMDADTSHISLTIIDGSKPTHPDSASVVTFNSGEDSTSVLSGFTITGGAGTLSYDEKFKSYTRGGGGIHATGGVKITNNTIVNNHVEGSSMLVGGGGIAAYPGSEKEYNVIIRNNLITGNSLKSHSYAQGAGMVTGAEIGFTVVENNTISNNISTCTGSWKANAGGLMLASWQPWNCKLIVRNNKIIENEIRCGSAQGGAIFLTFPPFKGSYVVTNATIEIYNNIIANNSSMDYAGGVAFWDQNRQLDSRVNPLVAFYNNTVINNKARRNGVGLFNYQMKLLVYNNIFNNELIRSETEIFNDDLRYSDFEKNKGIIYSYFNFVSDNSYGDDNIWGDPMVDSLTFKLAVGSPCIGIAKDSVEYDGSWYFAPKYDFNEKLRQNAKNRKIDLGAIESPYLAIRIDTLSENSDDLADYPVIDVHQHIYSSSSYSSQKGEFISPSNYRLHFELLMEVMKKNNVVLGVAGADYWELANLQRLYPEAGDMFCYSIGFMNKRYSDTIASIREKVLEGIHNKSTQAIGELLGPYYNRSANEINFHWVYAVADSFSLPVTIHSGIVPLSIRKFFPNYSNVYASPADLRPVLERWPNVNFNAAHACISNIEGINFLDTMVYMLKKYPNFYFDLGAITWYDDFGKQKTKEIIKKVVADGLEDKILYGSDEMVWPDAITVSVNFVKDADYLTTVQKKKILYFNNAQFLGLKDAEIQAHFGNIDTGIKKTKATNHSLSVYPNPTSSKVTVHFTVATKQAVKLSIYNVLGQQEVGLLNEVRPPGEYKIDVDISALRSGVYFMVLENNTKTTTKLIKQ